MAVPSDQKLDGAIFVDHDVDVEIDHGPFPAGDLVDAAVDFDRQASQGLQGIRRQVLVANPIPFDATELAVGR